MEADLKRDERGVRATEESLAPLVLAFYICTYVAAAESDIPLAVRNACVRFKDNSSVEVEFHGAFSVGIAVLLITGIFKLLRKLIEILGEVVCVEVDGNSVVVAVRALVCADKGDDAEGRRILRRQDHQIDKVVAARSAQISEEDKALTDHIVDVDAAEDCADVGRISEFLTNLNTDRLRAIVFIGKIRLIGNVRYAEWHIDISDCQIAARKDRFDAGGGSLCRVVDAVRSHIGVRHHIGAAKHRDGGEREYEIGRAGELAQIYDLSCIYGFSRKIGLSGELFPVGRVEGKLNYIRALIGGITVCVGSHCLTRQRNVGVKHRFREVRGNTNVLIIIYNVADIGRRSCTVQILLILLTGYLRCCGAASVILKIYNKIGRIF